MATKKSNHLKEKGKKVSALPQYPRILYFTNVLIVAESQLMFTVKPAINQRNI
jgi:hypothetical protein